MDKEGLFHEVNEGFGQKGLKTQETQDEILTIWTSVDQLTALLKYLKNEITNPFCVLYDLTAVDMRAYCRRGEKPEYPFVLVYHLLSYDRNCDLRVKIGLSDEFPVVPSITATWPSANWYEREVYDMFGIKFQGHPHLTRILMPPTWQGHPLRKEHPARATEMPPFELPEDKLHEEQEALQFNPEAWGMKRESADSDFMFLNIGPQHPGTHGVLRLVLQLSGEDIVDIVPDIGFHHRGAEKMAERQSWHTFIPYTDRIDYLGGVLNNLAYVQAVEKLAGIAVPPQRR